MKFFGRHHNESPTHESVPPSYPPVESYARNEHVEDDEVEKPSRCKRYACWALLLFLAAGTISSLSVVLTGSPNPVDFFIPVDPPGMKEAIRWDYTAGLQLTVEDALNDIWKPFLVESLNDWTATEALSINTVDTFYDPDCSAIFGRLKVCNGDYGRTNWKGLNVVFMRNDHIVHSVSKLNDYWLTDDDARLYTMCHELGHGWGLPHTDENHLNRDRGDCMDYTERPWNNLRPGNFNLNLMEELYGTPQQPLTVGPAAPNTGPVFGSGGNNDKEKDNKEKDKDDRRQTLRRRRIQEDPYDDAMFALYQSASKDMEMDCDSDICEKDLGNNCKIRMSKMLVSTA